MLMCEAGHEVSPHSQRIQLPAGSPSNNISKMMQIEPQNYVTMHINLLHAQLFPVVVLRFYSLHMIRKRCETTKLLVLQKSN